MAQQPGQPIHGFLAVKLGVRVRAGHPGGSRFPRFWAAGKNGTGAGAVSSVANGKHATRIAEERAENNGGGGEVPANFAAAGGSGKKKRPAVIRRGPPGKRRQPVDAFLDHSVQARVE